MRCSFVLALCLVTACNTQARWESRFDQIRADADERAAAFDPIELTIETPLEPVPTDLPRVFLTRESVTFDPSPIAPRVFPADEGARESALPHPFTVEAGASADLARVRVPNSREDPHMAGWGPPVLVYVEPRVPSSLLLTTLHALGATARVVVRGPAGIGVVGFDTDCVESFVAGPDDGIIDWAAVLGFHVTADELHVTAYNTELCASLRVAGGEAVIVRDAAAHDLDRLRTCAGEGREFSGGPSHLVDAAPEVDAQRIVEVLAAFGGLDPRPSLCDRQPLPAAR